MHRGAWQAPVHGSQRVRYILATKLVCRLYFVTVQSLSCVWLFATPWNRARHTSLSFTIFQSLFKLMSIELWCYLTISPSAAFFSFCLQSFPASGSFPMSWLFVSGVQSIGASALASFLSMNIQGWFPLRFTGLISSMSKGLSRVFSNPTVQKHQFFGTQLCLWFNSYIHTWLQEKS